MDYGRWRLVPSSHFISKYHDSVAALLASMFFTRFPASSSVESSYENLRRAVSRSDASFSTDSGEFSLRWWRCWLQQHLVALIVLLPTELSDYAHSMIATTLWVANIYFWHTSDYFVDATSRPLLHTWSLGVEEQYYLLFPLITPRSYAHALRRRRLFCIERRGDQIRASGEFLPVATCCQRGERWPR